MHDTSRHSSISQRMFRFPSFIGEAADKDAAKDADVPAHRKTNAVSSG
jgi:hypothetical protein